MRVQAVKSNAVRATDLLPPRGATDTGNKPFAGRTADRSDPNRGTILLAAVVATLAFTCSAKAATITRKTPTTSSLSVTQGQTQFFEAEVSGLVWGLSNWDEARWYVDNEHKRTEVLGGQSDSSSFSYQFNSTGVHRVKVNAKYRIYFAFIPVTYWTNYIYWDVAVTAPSATVTVCTPSGGTVSPSPGSHTYNKGTSVSIKATPSTCYQFVRWNTSGGVSVTSSTAASTTMKVNFDGNLCPVFEKKRYTVTVSTPTGGTVSPSPGNHTYDCGASVSIRATASTGYQFVRWDHSFGISVTNTTAASTSMKVNGDGTLLVQFERKKVAVPNVIGKTQSQAEAAITAAGLSVGRIIWTQSSAPAGQVVGQNPSGGTQVDAGSAVELTLSQGPTCPQNIPVPKVTGKTQNQAQLTLTSSGLLVGTITQSYSPTVPAGQVISQSPVAGSQVPAGSRVNLTVSRGPEPDTDTDTDTDTGTDTGAGSLLVDSDFEASFNSPDLYADAANQDWYESALEDPTLVTLDLTNVAGNDSKKAKLTASQVGRAYLTQEFSSPQTQRFMAEWRIYVDSILDRPSSPYDRAAWMFIGDDTGTTPDRFGPNAEDSERFVYLGFYKAGGGNSGTMDLVARESSTTATTFVSVAMGLSLKRWYTIKVICDLDRDTYDVYIDGQLQGTVKARTPKDVVTHISFAGWTQDEGAATFYVDDVSAESVASTSTSTCCGVKPGDRVILMVNTPLDSQGVPAAGLYAGTLGTVVCCDSDDPDLPVFVSWDDWANGKSNDSYCDPPVMPYTPNSGWWVSCEDIDPWNHGGSNDAGDTGDGLEIGGSAPVIKIGNSSFSLSPDPSVSGSSRTYVGSVQIEVELNFRARLSAQISPIPAIGGMWSAWLEPAELGPGTVTTTLWVRGEDLDLAAFPAGLTGVQVATITIFAAPVF